MQEVLHVCKNYNLNNRISKAIHPDSHMFDNREQAAALLANEVAKQEWEHPIVVALPRGGVPVGAVVAQKIKAPLEIVVPRKIGSPQNDEYAIGAVTEDGEVIWNEVEHALANEVWAEKVIEKERTEARRRRKLYGLGKKKMSFKHKQVIIVDDGIATGLTMRAAIASVRMDEPAQIIVAVPVASKDSLSQIKDLVDSVICLDSPGLFMAVGSHYRDFPQVNDEQVIGIMKASRL